ncbi:Heavy metal-associated isoprenylated plant protein 36 [Glycine max]|nr:Heavy metal-associated isoprenylated plant protein 36 [Glycine max]
MQEGEGRKNHALILQNNAVGEVCPSVIVTLYFDSHPSLPAQFAPQQSAHPQVHSWHFLPFFFIVCPTLTSSFSPSNFNFPLSMDAKRPQLATQPLNYQTWFLKVSIHCEGCRRKVKKVLKSIDGVFTATIDQQQQKVTVTGSVGVEILLRKLVRAGKHAEMWPENLNRDKKISGKGHKKNEAREPQSLENKGTENATTANCNSGNKSSNNSPEKSPSGDHVPAESGGGGSGKKKKKKVQSGNGNGRSSLSSEAAASTGAPANTGLQFEDLVGQVNVSPPRQQSLSYPETAYYPSMVYVSAYDRFYPSYYYVPSSPYIRAGLDQDGYYHVQSAPLVSFEIFSDENANGCSVM